LPRLECHRRRPPKGVRDPARVRSRSHQANRRTGREPVMTRKAADGLRPGPALSQALWYDARTAVRHPPAAPGARLMNDGPQGPRTPAPSPQGGADSRIQGGSIRLLRVAGIDVLLHWSWFLFAFLRLQSSRSDDSFGLAHYDSQVWYVVEYVALFG